MFDIGFSEIVFVSILALLVIGPKRLPEVVRSLSLWIGRIRRTFRNIKTEMESELNIDEVRRQLHNEEIMNNLKGVEDSANKMYSSTEDALKDVMQKSVQTPIASTTDTNNKTDENTLADQSATETPAPDATKLS